MTNKWILIFASCLVLAACANVQKMIDRGQYDQAIDHLTNKLEGQKKRDKDNVLALEFAFKKAQENDLMQEKSLRNSDDAEKWNRMYALHNRMEDRQKKIEPFVPLVAEDGYQASFQFVNLEELKKESKRNAADFYYQSAQTLLDEARRNGDKQAAQKAFQQLNRIDPLFSQYKDKETLKKVALDLGKKHYLVRMNNHTQQIIPEAVEREMLSIGLDQLNSQWKAYDVVHDPSLRYDYYIELDLTQMEFSPEREKSRVFDDINEIVKEEIVKDKNGKPVKDSLGREVKEKVKTRYVATIEEVTQLKTVSLQGRLKFVHGKTGDVETTKPLEVEGFFENKFSRLIKGDRDFLTDESKKNMKGKSLPFPSNESLLLTASEKMKKQLRNQIDAFPN